MWMRAAVLVVAAAGAIAAALPALADDQIRITSNDLTLDQTQSLAIFTGNVVLVRDDLTIWSSKVEVTYGAGGVQEIEKAVFTGGVRLKNPDQEATGNWATYDPKTRVMRLLGDVTLESAAGVVKGPELIFDLANETTTFPSAGQRVTGVFTAE